MKKPIKSFLSVILVLTMLLISFSMITSADNAQTTEDIVLDEILNIENTEKTENEIADYAIYKENASYSVGTGSFSVNINKTLKDSKIEFEIDVIQDGLYNFGLSYKALGDSTSNLIFGLMIDGKYPFAEAEKLNLFRIFRDADGGNRVDGLGNEFAPEQVHFEGFYFDNVSDITRWTDEEYLFALSQGKHVITLVNGESEFEIESVTFSAPEDLNEYKKPKDSSKYYNGKPIIIEGESAKLKTGNWLTAKSENATLDVTPNDTYKVLSNYIGGGNWKTPGQVLEWETPELEEGYYKLGFSFRQSGLLGAKVYRRLKIDGKVPFDDADAVGFSYAYKWQSGFFADDNNDPYLIYLSKGKHTISFEVTAGEITEVRNLLKKVVADLSDLYVEITMITGESVDIYRDYDLFEQIPDMEKTLKEISKNLEKSRKTLQKITGEKSGSYISIINNMKQIVDLMADNRYVAHRYKDEYYSKYTSLASVLFEMSDMPLDIDKFILVSPSEEEPFDKANGFEKLLFGIKRFLVSFSSDYNNISGTDSNDNGITIWVNWGRDQAQVLNSLIQSDFTPETDIRVDVQIVNASVVQAVLSGQGPDCLLQHSRSEPVNLAMRGMLYDLKQFKDIDEVLGWFQDGAELPYYYKDGLYGLPDTQSFYLMFYRTDIFEEMGLSVPETWDDFKEIVKLLSRNNLTAWLPNNTATSTAQANIGIGSINIFPTLLMQQGLDIYQADGKATRLSNSDVIMAFNEWTDFYTKLKLPRTMDFYNRFRTGTCPIGISSYNLYTTLKAAAPEIDGLWDVALVPGTKDENGNINHTSTGGGSACSIFDLPTTNPKQAWEFLKWWVSADTQLSFSSEVESILGPTGRVSVSNVEAFERLEWDSSMKDVIMTAMKQASEVPEYPGSYYVSRSVYQAFWNVIENNKNAKQTLLQFASEADEEIARKWKQYENR